MNNNNTDEAANANKVMTLGVNYDDSKNVNTDIDFADVVVNFADLLNTLKDALLIFNEQSQQLGPHVTWSNTKLLSFSALMPTSAVFINALLLFC